MTIKDFKSKFANEELTLKAKINNTGKANCIFIESVSRRATHIIVYRRPVNLASTSYEDFTENDSIYKYRHLSDHMNNEIPVTGFNREYHIIPALFEENTYFIGQGCTLQAQELIKLNSTITYHKSRIKSYSNDIAQKVTVSLTSENDQPLPWDELYYSIDTQINYKYPLSSQLLNSNGFTLYIPYGSSVNVKSFDKNRILINSEEPK